MTEMTIFTNAFDKQGGDKEPKNVKWVFNKSIDSTSPQVYCEDTLFSFDNSKNPKYGWITESSEIAANLIKNAASKKQILKNYYKKIFTNDFRLINEDPELFVYGYTGSLVPWVDEYKIFDKNKLCSFITSFKNFTSGHRVRLQLFDFLKDKPLFDGHIYGRNYRPVENKIEALKDYMFSIAIENSAYPKYYTEKVTDCFATGTVPIYYGDKAIGEDFNKDGIIFLDELGSLDRLTPELYQQMLPAIQDNYNRVINLKTSDDFIFEKIQNYHTK